MSTVCLWLIGVLYLIRARVLLVQRNWPMAFVVSSYATANAGLAWALSSA